jgi:hypothetical protein
MFNLFHFRGVSFLIGLLCIGILFLLGSMVTLVEYGYGSSYMANALTVIIAIIAIFAAFIIGLIALVTYYVDRVHYAITDQRIILAKSGIINETVVSALHENVVAVTVSRSRFSRGRGQISFSVPSNSVNPIVWYLVKDPEATHKYIMDVKNILDYYRQRGHSLSQAAMIGGAVAANLAIQTKLCWNCGCQLDASAKFCRYCAAEQA